jgi:hypothetical protein
VKRNTSPLRTLALSAVAAVAFMAWQVASLPKSELAGFSRLQQHRFESLQLGAPKAVVLEGLGMPRNTWPTCNLPQRRGFEEAFRRAEASGATEYLLWVNGMNWFYCVGFDAQARVVFTGEGHS